MPFEFRSWRVTRAIGKSPSLLWARTWQKQGRIQFIRRPVRVNPADVVNAPKPHFPGEVPDAAAKITVIFAKADIRQAAAIQFHRAARECKRA
jgi:hypothetical protein